MALFVREHVMGSSGVTVIFVVPAPSGWEARHRSEVLYWGPSLDRTVREARRLADLYENAHVVVEGMLGGPSAREGDETDTRADYAW
jgi:hypothetical protein